MHCKFSGKSYLHTKEIGRYSSLLSTHLEMLPNDNDQDKLANHQCHRFAPVLTTVSYKEVGNMVVGLYLFPFKSYPNVRNEPVRLTTPPWILNGRVSSFLLLEYRLGSCELPIRCNSKSAANL